MEILLSFWKSEISPQNLSHRPLLFLFHGLCSPSGPSMTTHQPFFLHVCFGLQLEEKKSRHVQSKHTPQSELLLAALSLTTLDFDGFFPFSIKVPPNVIFMTVKNRQLPVGVK